MRAVWGTNGHLLNNVVLESCLYHLLAAKIWGSAVYQNLY